MKKTYDLAPNFRGFAAVWPYGWFEKMQKHSLAPAPEYVIVECPRAFYRIAKKELNDSQIQTFLRRASKLSAEGRR